MSYMNSIVYPCTGTCTVTLRLLVLGSVKWIQVDLCTSGAANSIMHVRQPPGTVWDKPTDLWTKRHKHTKIPMWYMHVKVHSLHRWRSVIMLTFLLNFVRYSYHELLDHLLVQLVYEPCINAYSSYTCIPTLQGHAYVHVHVHCIM